MHQRRQLPLWPRDARHGHCCAQAGSSAGSRYAGVIQFRKKEGRASFSSERRPLLRRNGQRRAILRIITRYPMQHVGVHCIHVGVLSASVTLVIPRLHYQDHLSFLIFVCRCSSIYPTSRPSLPVSILQRIPKPPILQIRLILLAHLPPQPLLLRRTQPARRRLSISLLVLRHVVHPPRAYEQKLESETCARPDCPRHVARCVVGFEDLRAAHVSYAVADEGGGGDDGFFGAAGDVGGDCCEGGVLASCERSGHEVHREGVHWGTGDTY